VVVPASCNQLDGLGSREWAGVVRGGRNREFSGKFDRRHVQEWDGEDLTMGRSRKTLRGPTGGTGEVRGAEGLRGPGSGGREESKMGLDFPKARNRERTGAMGTGCICSRVRVCVSGGISTFVTEDESLLFPMARVGWTSHNESFRG
jgi:hypothetical protein